MQNQRDVLMNKRKVYELVHICCCCHNWCFFLLLLIETNFKTERLWALTVRWQVKIWQSWQVGMFRSHIHTFILFKYILKMLADWLERWRSTIDYKDLSKLKIITQNMFCKHLCKDLGVTWNYFQNSSGNWLNTIK